MKKAIDTIKTISTSDLESVTGGQCRRVCAKEPGLQIASPAASTSGWGPDGWTPAWSGVYHGSARRRSPRLQMASRAASTSGHYNDRE